MLEDYPPALVPTFVTEMPNTPVSLYSGQMSFGQNGYEFEGSGSITLEWLPNPHLSVTFATQHTTPQLELLNAELIVDPLSMRVPINITEIAGYGFDQNGPRARARVQRIETGAKACARIRFHLPNFLEFWGEPVRHNSAVGTRRAVLEYDSWKVKIDSVLDNHEPLVDQLRRAGGFAITHVGTIERNDQAEFAVADCASLLNCLTHFLSFCRGAWTHPILLQYENAEGESIGQQWSAAPITPFRSVRYWIPATVHISETLYPAFTGYARAWFSAVWHEPLKAATAWYLECNSSPIETALVLAQIVFELTAWTRFVEERAILTPDAFGAGRLEARDKLRLLLSTCAIQLAIPNQLAGLMKYGADAKLDGPSCLVQLRNALVHMDRKKLEKLKLHPSALLDGWQLAMWYLDLIILHITGYRGRYSNRLVSGWLGDEVHFVPWLDV